MLQITEPPDIAAALFQVGVPAAEGICDEDGRDPDQIGSRKAVAEAGRKEFQRTAERGRREQEERMPAIVDRVDSDVENMREGDMKEEKEKRNAAENDKRIAEGEIEFLEIG